MAGKKLDRESEDYPSNLLVVVQEKLLKLQEHLDNQDVPEMLRHIADREVHTDHSRACGDQDWGCRVGVENQRAD